jgi:serine/threonine protein kinase
VESPGRRITVRKEMKLCKRCNSLFPDDMGACPIDGTSLVAPEDPFVGQLVGGCYRIQSKIAEGGIGRVYLARHLYLDRNVAAKILKPTVASSREVRDRVLREARIGSTIEHPNIVKVYDMFTTSSSMVVVMELLQGETLKTRLKRVGRMDFPATCAIATMTAEALSRAHSLDIIHRDIKPSNIFLAEGKGAEDFVKLLDFGIAFAIGEERLTKQGGMVGTPPYCPPEQLLGKPPTKASDVYALGCVIYQLLTGRTPFASEDMGKVIAGHLRETPAPISSHRPDVPDGFNAILMKMLAKSQEDRFEDAFEFLHVIRSEGFYAYADEALLRSSSIPSKPIDDAEIEVEIEMDTESTGSAMGEYFKRIGAEADETVTQSESFTQGVRSARDLAELEESTRRIVRDMEILSEKRRTYHKNIGRALEVLSKDLSRLRMDYARRKMEYVRLTTERDHLEIKLRIDREKLSLSEKEASGEQKAALSSRVGETLRELEALAPRIEEMQAWRKGTKAGMKDMKFQIAELSKRLLTVEEEFAEEYEMHRQRLDELSGRAEQLRQVVALAVCQVGAAKT